MYTGLIKFAAINSHDITGVQGGCSDDKKKLPQDSGGPDTLHPDVITVEPCSPKSIYHLAGMVCLAFVVGDALINFLRPG